MTQSLDRQYEYKPRWSVIAISMLFFAALAVVFGALAHARRPIARFGVKILSAEAAAVFWWCFVVVCLAPMLYGLMLAVSRLVHSQRIVFTPTAIIVPKSRWSSAEVTIPYLAITDLSFSQANGQRLLRITYGDRKITLTSWFLPANRQFEEVRYLLEELVQEARGRGIVS